MQKAISKFYEKSYLKTFAEILLGAFFLGMFAKVYIPLFFTPVPLILQNSIALAYGYFFKTKTAVFSVLLFVLLGTLGFPFFSGGSFGLDTILSIKGAYILSYALGTLVVSLLLQKTSISLTSAILFGHFIVLLCGWVNFSMYVGMQKAFMLGVLPFIAGDILKTIVITKVFKCRFLKNKF